MPRDPSNLGPTAGSTAAYAREFLCLARDRLILARHHRTAGHWRESVRDRIAARFWIESARIALAASRKPSRPPSRLTRAHF